MKVVPKWILTRMSCYINFNFLLSVNIPHILCNLQKFIQAFKHENEQPL